MSDYASHAELPPPFLGTYSRYSGLWESKNATGAVMALASTSWTTVNQARYYPISIPFAYPVVRVWWSSGSSTSGNRCFAIYTRGGVQLYTTGSTAAGSANVPQFVTPGTPFILPPGDYYFAFNSSQAANGIAGAATTGEFQRFGGVQQEAVGATALPAVATFAAATVTGVNSCGVTWTPSGF